MKKYSFEITIDGMNIMGNIDFASLSKPFRNIFFENCKNNKLRVLVKKDSPINVINIEEAKFEVEVLADKLSLLPGHAVRFVYYLGYYDELDNFFQSEETKNKSIKLATAHANFADWYKTPQNQKILKSKYNQAALRMYRLSMGIVDKFSEYLVLYGVLTILISDELNKENVTQKEIDNAILKLNPTVHFIERGRRVETIFTKIRNKIGHPNSGEDLVEAFDQTSKYLPLLREMVRDKLIENSSK